MAMSALEVGFKSYAAEAVPQAAWLIENIPSPPLLKLLRDYLPTLAPEGAAPIPKRLLTIVNKAVEARDKTVHLGREAPEYPVLSDVFDAVADVLRLLDSYRGHAWALDALTDETAKGLRLLRD